MMAFGEGGEGSAAESYPSSKGRHARATGIGPYLVLAINSQQPFDRPLRIPLGDSQRVNLRRGAGRAVRHGAAADGTRTCDVFVADSTMEMQHAFVALGENGGHWLWDCGSKNGTSQNGDPLTGPVELLDGDWIGVGCSFFLFRSATQVVGAYASSLETEAGVALTSLNPLLSETMARASRLALGSEAVLISGPTGSGRRTLARQMHVQSGRPGEFKEASGQRFLEELFAFKEAHAGTLYLRDVEALGDEARLCVQRGLLNEETVTGVSGSVRLIGSCSAAALASLPAELVQLFGGRVVSLPALHLRREDLGQIVAEILKRCNAPTDLTFRRSLSRALGMHRWRENIAGLEQGIRYGLEHRGADDSLELVHMPRAIQQTETEALERRRFVALARRHEGNVDAIAAELRINRRSVYKRAKRYNVELAELRPPKAEKK